MTPTERVIEAARKLAQNIADNHNTGIPAAWIVRVEQHMGVTELADAFKAFDAAPVEPSASCPVCDGRGEVSAPTPDGSWDTQHCPECKLLPCPFCGSEAVPGKIDDDDGDPPNPDQGGHFIQCSNAACGASTNLRFAGGDDPRPLLAEQWNRRAPQPHPGSERDRALVEHPALEFTRQVLRGSWTDDELKSSDIQDRAEELGLLIRIGFDPEKHDDEAGTNIRPGDDWFEFSPLLRTPAKGPE